jgi:hypothetical protein
MKTNQSARVLMYMAISTIFAASCSKNELAPDSGNVSLIPTVTTTAASLITYNSAVSGGTVSNDGGSVVSRRGLVWSTNPYPTLESNNGLLSSSLGTGSFSSTMPKLAPETKYYARAFATNNKGTAYGNPVDFTTNNIPLPKVFTAPANGITTISASSGGTISDEGGTHIITRGVCWSTSQNPTIADSKTDDGVGTGSYTSSIDGLAAVTTYYIRAYATNSQGTSYGNQVQFITARGLPSLLLTDPWLDETVTKYFSGGYIISDGGDAITARGVCWSTSPNPTTSDTKTTDGTGTVSYTSIITGLNPATTYYIRAYATNSFGTAYSDEQSFTTQ